MESSHLWCCCCCLAYRFFFVSFASYKKQATYAWCPTVRTDLNLNTFVLAETHRELSRDENTHTHTHI